MFWLSNKENSFPIRTLIWRPVSHHNCKLSYNTEPGQATINPFEPNGFSHRFQLEQSISVLKGCLVVFFIFIQTLIEHSVSKRWSP